jgi:hypothetical protein
MIIKMPKRLKPKYALLIVALVTTISVVYLLTSVPKSPALFASNLAILIISFLGLSSGRQQAYSLVKIVFIFTFFFFGVVPLNDLTNGNVYWGARAAVRTEVLVLTNILILIGLATFFLGSKVRTAVFNFLPRSIDKKNLQGSGKIFPNIYISWRAYLLS